MADAAVFEAVRAAADAGRPLSPRDLLRYEAPAVRTLFDQGLIERKTMTFGGQPTVVIMPSSGPYAGDDHVEEVDDQAFDDAEVRYLEVAYTGGVSFGEMQRALKRSGTEILREAWKRELDRPGALYARPRRAKLRSKSQAWATDVPAWRFKRLRGLLEEARFRGQDLNDGGEDLTHRALRRAFELGRRGQEGKGRLVRHHQRWTDQEHQELARLRQDGLSIAEISRVLSRSIMSISTKVYELGLDKRTAPWTEDEDRIIAATIERGGTNKDAAELLPRRSVLACKARARFLMGPRGFVPWRPDEKEDLRRAILAGENIKLWAKAHGRGVSAVRWQCRNMGLRHPAYPKEYTPEEDDRIRAGWVRKEPAKEVAAALGRPLRSVYNRAFVLGLTGRGVGHHHRCKVRRFEVDYIRARAAQGWTAGDVSKRMNRSIHVIYKIAALHGISWRRGRSRKREDLAA